MSSRMLLREVSGWLLLEWNDGIWIACDHDGLELNDFFVFGGHPATSANITDLLKDSVHDAAWEFARAKLIQDGYIRDPFLDSPEHVERHGTKLEL